MSDLKPCIACQGTELYSCWDNGSMKTECLDCGLTAHTDKWNNRPHENKIKAEAIREALAKHAYEHPFARGYQDVSVDDLHDYANKLEQGE